MKKKRKRKRKKKIEKCCFIQFLQQILSSKLLQAIIDFKKMISVMGSN